MRNTNAGIATSSSFSWTVGGWGSTAGDATVISVTDAPNPDIVNGYRLSDESTTAQANVYQHNIPTIVGMQYTVSCYVRLVSGSPTPFLRQISNGVGEYLAFSVPGTAWEKISYTFYSAFASAAAMFGITAASTGAIEICGMKLELGNKATDWSPSPWDISIGDTGWLDIIGTSIATSAITAPPSGALKYRKKNGVVYIQGVFGVNMGTTATTLFTLPAGYRPVNWFCSAGLPFGYAIGRILVGTGGAVSVDWIRNLADGTAVTGTISWMSVNISFPV